jgi:hypothetical protein
MCPNCLNGIAIALGVAGPTALFAAAGLRFRTVRKPTLSLVNTEETAS